ncbi:MAG: DUF2752 domain-containing protein, partial [Actinobacteria bacterium]|nr:DUF2752 domain-containing protein [Actinomycetota bacterium]
TVDLAGLRPAGALMLGAAALFAVAPGDQGLPCPLRATTGVPCPFCGMTTSVVNAVRLDLASAWAANPAGIIAVITAVLLVLVRRPTDLAVPWWAIGVTGAAMWLFQLHRFAIL